METVHDSFGEGELRGTVYLAEGRISLSNHYYEDSQRETLLHEILHAIVYSLRATTDWLLAEEEEVIGRITPLLLDTIQRNPDLITYLMGKDDA